jgi:glutathione S-transferase
MATDLHLVVGNKAYSSWSLRPWVAMKAHGLVFQETVIHLNAPDTKARILSFSPAGKVPVLQHGDITVWESLAILDCLAEAFYDRHWWPADPHARAMARAISAEMHGGFSALRSNMPMNVRRHIPGKDRAEGVDTDIARITSIWRACRAKFGAGGPFLFGAFSNADAMYAPVVTRFKTYGVELDAESESYSDAILNHPAMKEWYAAAADESWIVGKFET